VRKNTKSSSQSLYRQSGLLVVSPVTEAAEKGRKASQERKLAQRDIPKRQISKGSDQRVKTPRKTAKSDISTRLISDRVFGSTGE
jgi:hypothetical protein